MMQSNSMRKTTAWVAMIATVLVMLFSCIFISNHVNHECTGHDCPVCAVVSQCENNLKTIGAVIAVCIGLFLFVQVAKAENILDLAFVADSLISQKVRMNN